MQIYIVYKERRNYGYQKYSNCTKIAQYIEYDKKSKR